MMKREWIGGIGLTFLIAVLFSPLVAAGQLVINYTISGSGSVSGSAETTIDWDEVLAKPTQTFSWNSLLDPAYYHADGNYVAKLDLGGGNIAVIDSFSIGVKAEPFIDFTFSARSANGPTHFSFSSTLLTLNPALTNAIGSAWAYPSPGPPDTILSGDFTNNKVYRSEYNGGTVFADLSDAPIPFLPPGNGYDAVGSTPISGQVSSMQVQWGFTLSSGGQATGSSHFEITGTEIPEPATVILLGLGGLALIRKHRA